MSDMPREELRQAGHQAIDWVAQYLDEIREYPVLARVEPGELARSLPVHAPEEGESIEAILADFEQRIIPAVTHWNHPRFHAYFSVSASGPGVLAELLTAALNVNGMVWKSCPAATELEQRVMLWLRQWLGLPQNWFGIIYDTASISTMHALACAREFVAPEARLDGNSGHLTVYTSEQAHSSVEKSAIAIGLGQRNVRKIAVDERFRLRADLLRDAIAADIRDGKRPCCVVPTVGTTSTTAIDPVREAVAIAREAGAWVHVDASYAGPAAILPEMRWTFDAVESADSLVVNPHKWLFTPIDLSAFYTARPDILRRAFTLVPEYLKTAQDEIATNYMDYGVPLGRRFRSLELWFVMRYFGRRRIEAILRNHIEWTRELAGWIEADARFELAAPAPFSLVCFRLRAGDEASRALMDRVNGGGTAFLSHTVLNGRFVLRLALGNIKLTHDDVQASWEAVRRAADEVSVG